MTCLVRESAEEASLPSKLVEERAVAVGTVTYFHIRDERAGGETRLLQPECQYAYDMELREDDSEFGKVEFEPNDDEVEAFELLSVEQVRDSMWRGEFKPNCAAVLLDFLIRHGVLHPGNETDYIEIAARLRRSLNFQCEEADMHWMYCISHRCSPMCPDLSLYYLSGSSSPSGLPHLSLLPCATSSVHT